MSQVRMPRRIKTEKGRQGQGANIGQILGTAAGAAIGSFAGPGGTMAGASLGGSLGGALGGAVDPGKAGSQVDETKQAVQTGGAMGRRGQALQSSQQNIAALKEGIYALKSAPPDIAQQYVIPLATAYKKATQG